MTIQLTTTHRRLAGALVGLWLGVQITVLSGWPVLILGLPLLGLLVFGLLDRSGALLPRGVAVVVGLMAAEAVFTVVDALGGGVVSPLLTLPLQLLTASVLGVMLGRSVRMVPAAAPVPVPVTTR